MKKQTELRKTWNAMTVPDMNCISVSNEPRHTAAEILAAAKEGEVSHVDAEYIVEVLQRNKTSK
jgi:hypothetical protein